MLSNTIRFAESSTSSGVWIGNLAGKKNISSNLIFNQTLYPHYPNRFNPKVHGIILEGLATSSSQIFIRNNTIELENRILELSGTLVDNRPT